MSDDLDRPQMSSRLLAEASPDAPSAAAAGQPANGDDGKPLLPVTAWTSPEDCEAMAKGLTARASPAEFAFARISRMIEDFEAKLDQNHEVGCTFVGLPGDATMRISDMGFWAPDLLLFYGKNGYGKPVRVLQHYTQMNVMLSAEPKEVPQEPPRRIGFALRERMEKAAAEGAEAPKAPEASA